jgi:hypothetical protein
MGHHDAGAPQDVPYTGSQESSDDVELIDNLLAILIAYEGVRRQVQVTGFGRDNVSIDGDGFPFMMTLRPWGVSKLMRIGGWGSWLRPA